MAVQLEAYSLMPTRGPVAEPDWEPVGVTLTLNESFQRRIGTAASKVEIVFLFVRRVDLFWGLVFFFF